MEMIIVAIVLIAIAIICVAGVVCAIMDTIEERRYDKFNSIMDAYYNGQKEQFFEKIKNYGKKAFMLDVISNGSFDKRTQLMLIETVLKGGA